MVLIASLLMCLFWFGPAAALLLLALILEQRRHAPNGTKPQGNIVLRSLVGGIVAALIWVALVTVLVVASGKDNAALWIAATPWAFALGQAVGLIWKPARSRAD